MRQYTGTMSVCKKYFTNSVLDQKSLETIGPTADTKLLVKSIQTSEKAWRLS